MVQQRVIQQSESPITTTDSRPVPDPTSLTTQQLGTAVYNLKELLNTRLDAMDKAVDLLQSLSNRSPTIGETYLKFDERFISFNAKLVELEKLMISKISEGIGIHASKIDSMEKRLDHKYVESATDLKHLHDLMSERISGLTNQVAGQFTEMDKRSTQLNLANATAIERALMAQKEAASETQKSSYLAITKAENATADSIKQLQALFQTSIQGLSTQVADVKSRLDKGEGGQVGGRAVTEDYRYERGARREETVDNRGLIFGIVGSVMGLVMMAIAVAAFIATKGG